MESNVAFEKIAEALEKIAEESKRHNDILYCYYKHCDSLENQEDFYYEYCAAQGKRPGTI
jgi:rubrerythrin